MAKAPQRVDAPALRRLAARVSGARLCYGKPVKSGGRTVVPVARVRVAGGWGFGTDPGADSRGGGGGGGLDARPVGFIEVGPEGARFQRIDDGFPAVRVLAGATVALVAARRLVRTAQKGGFALPRPARRRLPAGR